MSALRKAVFLDRDGVLINNSGHYYIWKEEDVALNPGVAETLAILRERGYLLIVISNQGGVSRGLYTRKDVEATHRHLDALLAKAGTGVDAFYFCPHHHKEEACLCRKPLPLLLEKAMARFGIGAALSWMVGDAQRDVQAGQAAGMRSLLVEANGDLRKILKDIP